MHYIGKVGCGTILVVGIALVGLILLASNVADMNQSNTQAIRQTMLQATVQAEYAKAQQTREEYMGKAAVIEAEAQAYSEKSAANLLTYVVHKSEERQDDMLYFLMTGETRQQTDERRAQWLFRTMAAALCLLVIVFVGAAFLRGDLSFDEVARWLTKGAR